ncbi:MAG: cysteine hydrolase [Ardenticatenales bacterium]|nr:cysteine hydrolase [Ardenticatenales bacterium]
MTTRDWGAFALLLIDVQEDFWPPALAAAFPDFPTNVEKLLATCREEGLEVVHLRALFRPDQADWMVRYKLRDWIPCISGTAGAELLPCAAALPGEKVLHKQTFDGFLNPELDAYLQSQGKQFVMVAGLVTSTCVLLTGIAAAQRGYLTALVADCSADEPEAHARTVESYLFALEMVESSEIVANYEKWQEQLTQLAAL